MEKDKICYKNNPLNEVIARLDFLSPLPEIDSGIPPKLRDIIKDKFPIAESQELVLREFQITPAGAEHKESKGMEYTFHDRNRTKRLSISAKTMYVVHYKYETYNSFSEDFLLLNSALLDHYKDAIVNRFGVRYVNNININNDPNPLDWSAYLNENLLGIINIPISKEIISRAFQILELNFGDYSLRFQFGMHNPDYPATIRQKNFTLDFDAYYTGMIGKQEVESYLPKFHDSVQTLFEQSITDNYRNLMGYV